jgi:hypothetical protein
MQVTTCQAGPANSNVVVHSNAAYNCSRAGCMVQVTSSIQLVETLHAQGCELIIN